jgi:O-antigen biosynthesis protein
MANPPIPELERLMTDTFTMVSVQHLHRYAMAAEICVAKDVLDIASGEGYGSNLLARTAKSVTGVDIASEAISHAKAKYALQNLSFVEGAVDSVPLGTSSIDVVVSFETLEHHDKHEAMLAEIKRVLRPSGLLIISTPDKRLYSEIPQYQNEYHVKELYTDEFKALIGRYFGRQRFLAQGLAFGTLVAPECDWGPFSCYSGDFQSCKHADQLVDAEYNLAIASDGELPDIGVSYFDAKQTLRNYERLLRSQEQVIGDLKDSFSFRLGRSLTWPIRRLFGT